jgi:hypothetical protein
MFCAVALQVRDDLVALESHLSEAHLSQAHLSK